MAVFWVRFALYTALPVLLGLSIVRLDPGASGPARRTEALLIPLFVIGVAGASFGGAVAHLFHSDAVADAIGWDRGSPFQLEVGFANLAIAVLGAMAASRRDGFREATVVVVTIFGLGATIVHVADLVETGNTSPGNTLQNLSNLARPALLIPLLVASRRAEATSSGADPAFDAWRAPILTASAACVMAVSTAFAIGFAIDRTVPLGLVGVVVGSVAFGWIRSGGRRRRARRAAER